MSKSKAKVAVLMVFSVKESRCEAVCMPEESMAIRRFLHVGEWAVHDVGFA
jgi:hypothetical protein